MAVLETIIKVVLALAAVAFVGYPFLRSVKEEEAPQLAPEEEQLLERKGIDPTRIADPQVHELRSECLRVRAGVFTCGKAGATGPSDRQVLARVFKSE